MQGCSATAAFEQEQKHLPPQGCSATAAFGQEQKHLQPQKQNYISRLVLYPHIRLQVSYHPALTLNGDPMLLEMDTHMCNLIRDWMWANRFTCQALGLVHIQRVTRSC
eukprot:GHUV01017237.1.p2 GENE.GHUV01017237.1~~GHUV01017237.1.p2  ORF type:complete len:108 (-),score=10.46 GHUV01017237.1:1164-1487(-)